MCGWAFWGAWLLCWCIPPKAALWILSDVRWCHQQTCPSMVISPSFQDIQHGTIPPRYPYTSHTPYTLWKVGWIEIISWFSSSRKRGSKCIFVRTRCNSFWFTPPNPICGRARYRYVPGKTSRLPLRKVVFPGPRPSISNKHSSIYEMWMYIFRLILVAIDKLTLLCQKRGQSFIQTPKSLYADMST